MQLLDYLPMLASRVADEPINSSYLRQLANLTEPLMVVASIHKFWNEGESC